MTYPSDLDEEYLDWDRLEYDNRDEEQYTDGREDSRLMDQENAREINRA